MSENPRFEENTVNLNESAVENFAYSFTYVDMGSTNRPEIATIKANTQEEADEKFKAKYSNFDPEQVGRIQIAN